MLLIWHCGKENNWRMAKSKTKKKLMERSNIPYATRLAMQREKDINDGRAIASRWVLATLMRVMHRDFGYGYQRIMEYSYRIRKLGADFYDDREIEQIHLHDRLNQLEFEWDTATEKYDEWAVDYCKSIADRYQRRNDIFCVTNIFDSTDVSLKLAFVALNDVLGIGKQRMIKIYEAALPDFKKMISDGDGEFKRIGEYLLDKGFVVGENGDVCGFINEETGKAIKPKDARKEKKPDAK